MLYGLDQVAWPNFSHAYGSAENVPGLLRKLASPQPEDWGSAVDELSNCIYHQESLYDASAPTVPFLIELLEYTEVKCRGRILVFLANLIERHDWFDRWDASDRDDDDDDEPDAEQLKGRETYRRYRNDVCREVWQHWETYLQLGTDVDKRIRLNVPYVLAHLRTVELNSIADLVDRDPACNKIVSALKSWSVDEPNPIVQASHVTALGKWAVEDASCLQVIAQLMENSPIDSAVAPVNLAAALALAEHPSTPRNAVDVLATAIENPKECKTVFKEPDNELEDRLNPIRAAMRMVDESETDDGPPIAEGATEDFRYPWMVWEVMPVALNALTALPKVQLAQLEGRLIKMWTQPSYRIWQSRTLVHKLLFADATLREMSSADLNPGQIAVLTYLFENATVWATRLSNTVDDVESLGVPYNRIEIARLLNRNPDISSQDEALQYLQSLVRAQLIWGKNTPGPNDPINQSHYVHLLEVSLQCLGCDHFMPLLELFPNLQTLSIGDRTTDDGLAAIGRLPKLHTITLNDKITDKGFAQLVRFPMIKQIWSISKLYTDAVADTILRLPNLKEVWLNETQFSDVGLKAITDAAPPIESIRLNGTSVSDASVEGIGRLRCLRNIYLENSAVSEAGAERIRELLPETRVYA